MITVIYKNQKIQLDEKDSLGTGGEATVIKANNLAFKIYHVSSPEKILKLKDFISSNFDLPDNVARPFDLVYDLKSEPIGFTMPIAKKCKEMIHLSNKKYRTQEQIDTNSIIKVFSHVKETLEKIHSNNLVVGDFNDLNALFNQNFLSVFIDVDSYQFGKYPCPVGTDQFIDPNLYGVDLTKKPSFSKQTDWYSFAVMFFKSLLFVHPYGGTHKTHQTLYDRAQNKIIVFDKNVIYPKMGLNPNCLNDELLNFFETIFKKAKRIDIPSSKFKELENSFEACKSCGLFYHKDRQQCPDCHKLKPQQNVDISQIIITKNIDEDKCIVENIYQTEGAILFTKVIDKTIYVIELINSNTFLHKFSDQKVSTLLWKQNLKNVRYEIFKNYLLVGSENDLMIFEISANSITPVTKTVTFMFDNVPMFGCSENKIYRLSDSSLATGEILHKNLFESILMQTLENQTWFKVGNPDIGCGFFRIFKDYHYFIFSKKGRFELDLPVLDGKIIETEAEFSINTILLLRKTLYKGRTWSHYHIIDDEGKIIDTKSEESLNSELLRTLSGKILVGSSIVHPSDAGIVIEKHKQLTLKKETSNYISSNDRLFLYKDGMLAVSDRKIIFIKLIK